MNILPIKLFEIRNTCRYDVSDHQTCRILVCQFMSVWVLPFCRRVREGSAKKMNLQLKKGSVKLAGLPVISKQTPSWYFCHKVTQDQQYSHQTKKQAQFKGIFLNVLKFSLILAAKSKGRDPRGRGVRTPWFLGLPYCMGLISILLCQHLPIQDPSQEEIFSLGLKVPELCILHESPYLMNYSLVVSGFL